MTDEGRHGGDASPARDRGLLAGRVHLLGAGGAGVSGLGRILRARGARVTGHDRAESALLEGLRQAGVEIAVGASRAADLPAGTEIVVRSAAVPSDDPQASAAAARGIPVLKYAQALGLVAPPRRALAVAGTHGKTTTAWMLWHALDGIAEELSAPVAGALIGGLCRRLDTNALAGSPDGWFCVEACEYDRSFLHLAPHGAIVTNVEAEHLDYYGNLSTILQAFARFACNVDTDGLVVLGRAVPEEVELGARSPVWRLGRELEVDLLGEERGRFRFRLRLPGFATPEVQLAVPGHFNVDNAALALSLAIALGAGRTNMARTRIAAAAVRGLERFDGVARRFETWGAEGEVVVVHDYAHHPSEVRVTLEAARRVFPDRELHVLFQPHQHSRTSRFLEEFAESLRIADRVVVTAVYGARRHIDGEEYAGAPELVLALARRGVPATAGESLGLALDRFLAGVPKRAAAFVLGAGDIEGVRDELRRRLALRCAPAGEPGR
ncbi:MAG: Mur ligase domain-containing protein [Planctomycetota bacterium]